MLPRACCSALAWILQLGLSLSPADWESQLCRQRMEVGVPGKGRKVQGKFVTECKDAQKKALECIEKNPVDRRSCDPLFAAYKACRKEEHNAILKARGEGR